MNTQQFNEACQLVHEFNDSFELNSSDRLLLKREGIFVILDDPNDSIRVYSVSDVKSTLEQLADIYLAQY